MEKVMKGLRDSILVVLVLLIIMGCGERVDNLIYDLHHKNWKVRQEAAKALGDIGDPSAIEPLITALKDEDKYVRIKAAEALGKIGTPYAIEPLITALKDEDKYVRGEVAEALVKIGKPVVEPLINVLRNEDSGVQWGAAEALVKIGKPAVEPLINVLRNEDSGVQWRAAEALGEIGDTLAINPLINVLRNNNSYVQESAAEALDKLGWKPKDDIEKAIYFIAKKRWDECVELDKPAVEPLIVTLKENKHRAIRKKSAEALGKIGDTRAIKPLINALMDKQSDVQRFAAEALGKIGDTRAIKPLINALRDSNVRLTAGEALLKIGCGIETLKSIISAFINNEDNCLIAVEKLFNYFPVSTTEKSYKIKKGFILANDCASIELPELVKAKNIDELTTLILINYTTFKVGKYMGLGKSADAYKYRAEVRIVDWRKKKCIKKRTFIGGEPPEKIERLIGSTVRDYYGSKPNAKVIDWLNKFY